MCDLMQNFRKHKWLADDCFFEFNDVVFIVNGEDNLPFDQVYSIDFLSTFVEINLIKLKMFEEFEPTYWIQSSQRAKI